MGTELDTETLTALCDVFVPAVRPPAQAPREQQAFFALTASEAGTAQGVCELLPTLLDDDDLDDLATLLGVLRGARIGTLPQPVALALLRTLASLDDDAGDALQDLRQLTMAVHYGGVGPDGTNPTWSQLDYPGPAEVELPDEPRLPTVVPAADAIDDGTWRLSADAVVIGSGAGGGVIAARLAAGGLDVLVLEAGADQQEEDFPTSELGALSQLYWRHGLVTTEDRNVTLLAGHTLGGGTTVNWSNWVRPPDHVRDEWADHGLDGIDGPDFDDDLDAVTERVGATDVRTRANGTNQRLLEGAKAVGWDVHMATRNVDPDTEDDRATGLTGYGDRTGAKQGTLRTFLRDAVADGARVVTSCEVQRIVTSDGRASGVVAWRTDEQGGRLRVEVDAPTVVVAAGALETPAVLLRSAIGGPAVGRHLRLHPVPVIIGMYDEPQHGYEGAPQSVVVDEKSDAWDGYGYLIEAAHWHPALFAAGIDWPDPRDAKVLMSRFGRMAPFIAVTRERGAGSVTVDDDGRSVVHHPLDDPLDQVVMQQGVRDLIDLHVAAGARAIIDLAAGRRLWRRGTPVQAFTDACAAVPMGATPDRPVFSAHQMGTARMGADRDSSVADPDGQLHDTPGVWIGDTSAFPSAVGSNPMFTTMALAHRTASRILASQ